MDSGKAMRLFDRLKDGQVCLLCAPASRAVFALKREWNTYGLPAYTILQDGKPVPGYIGMILGRDRVIDWLLDLEEVKPST